MRTTFFLTGLVAAHVGYVNSMKLELAGDSAAEAISASTVDLASQIDSSALLDAATDRKMKANNKSRDESDDHEYSKSECAAAFKKN